MQPGSYEITIYQGATFQLWFGLEFPDGSVGDPPEIGDGYTIGRMTIRDMAASDGGVELLSLTTDNGGVVLGLTTDANGEEWSGYLYASAAATAALVPWGEAQYDLEISDGMRVERVLAGVARLSPEITT